MKTCPRCGREFQDPTTLCPLDGTVLEKSGDELVGQMLTDRYRIDERISEGGMGTVYRATHVLMDKRVAIKVLHPSLAADDKIVARFSREARAASRISHPHALNVTDFGESESGVVFLVMEYLDGRTLKDIIQSEGPLPLNRAVEIVKQVAGALDAAHAEGVVHRDLKSDNIMLIAGANGSDWAKVLDFGIAKIKENTGNTDPGLTAPNLIIGTPQYMSPEQCSQASEIDARSDIYSLGVIIYEMLTGHVPFTGESPTAIMMKHLQEPPPSVLEERDDLPPQVGMVITSALAKRPEDRFQSAGELSDAFSSAAAGEQPARAVSAAATNPASASSETNRIVVPTDSNEAPRNTREHELDDEATVISARPAAVAYETEARRTTRISEPPPPQRSSPWRIVIPALAGLLVLFGVIYAITYRGNPAQPDANQAPGLTTDPNSKPVQAAPPPTGNAEQGIAPSANSNNSNANTGAPANVDPNAKPPENKNAEGAGAENTNTGNANRKERGQKNANTGEQNDNAAPKNDNQGDEPPPPPKSNSNGEAPPETKPRPKKVEPALPPPPPTSNISQQQ
ncbi:MAG: serine/threonine protein kinase [Pyrinomonadaceae bacterium]|nr:serine/threonine protein kinase [Pyrinomonadaceae bacterium]